MHAKVERKNRYPSRREQEEIDPPRLCSSCHPSCWTPVLYRQGNVHQSNGDAPGENDRGPALDHFLFLAQVNPVYGHFVVWDEIM